MERLCAKERRARVVAPSVSPLFPVALPSSSLSSSAPAARAFHLQGRERRATAAGKKLSLVSDTARPPLLRVLSDSSSFLTTCESPSSDSYSRHSCLSKSVQGTDSSAGSGEQEGEDTLFAPFLVNSPLESFTLNMR